MNEDQSINASSYHLHSITHRSIHSCIQSFISFIPSFAHSFIHRFIRSFLHSFAHRSSIQSFMQSLMHCIHSLISLSRFMPVIAAKLRPPSGQLVRPRVGGCASAGQIVRPTLAGGRRVRKPNRSTVIRLTEVCHSKSGVGSPVSSVGCVELHRMCSSVSFGSILVRASLRSVFWRLVGHGGSGRGCR
jgi:hypothetical protein